MDTERRHTNRGAGKCMVHAFARNKHTGPRSPGFGERPRSTFTKGNDCPANRTVVSRLARRERQARFAFESGDRRGRSATRVRDLAALLAGFAGLVGRERMRRTRAMGSLATLA